MTRTTALLVGLQDLKGGIIVQLIAAHVVLLALPLSLLADFASQLRRELLLDQIAREEHATCPNGHVVDLVSRGWTCGGCGATLPGHAFVPCGHCGLVAARVECPCSASVENPHFEALS